MSFTSSSATLPGAATLQRGRVEFWRGVLIGFLPLMLLFVVLAAAVALTAGVRTLTAGPDFSREQLATALTLGLGLALGFGVYAFAIARLLRRMAVWRLTGPAQRATGALWALASTALLVLVPVLLALIFP